MSAFHDIVRVLDLCACPGSLPGDIVRVLDLLDLYLDLLVHAAETRMNEKRLPITGGCSCSASANL